MAGAKKSSLRLLTEDSSSQRQRIVEHVCRDGQDQPRDRCQDTKPSPPRLNRDSKECAESPSEQRVSPQPEQRVSAAELPISAPIAEETAKAMGVLLIFWLLRPEFDNMRDGIVYGALVGIGFNWYEAALYVAQGYADCLRDAIELNSKKTNVRLHPAGCARQRWLRDRVKQFILRREARRRMLATAIVHFNASSICQRVSAVPNSLRSSRPMSHGGRRLRSRA